MLFGVNCDDCLVRSSREDFSEFYNKMTPLVRFSVKIKKKTFVRTKFKQD